MISVHTILIIEDDTAVAKVLSAYLSAAGYALASVDDGEQALDAFRRVRPALVLLDVALPNKDGWTILREIRAMSSCPVIMLTAQSAVSDRVEGLSGGADDYIGKPFDGAEVVARVKAVLRRKPMIDSESVLRCGRFAFDFEARAVYYDNFLVDLIPRDLSLLLFLAQHSGRIFTRETLIEKVWGIDFTGSDRAVDLCVKRIRQTLSALPGEPAPVETLRGLGYRFNADATS